MSCKKAMMPPFWVVKGLIELTIAMMLVGLLKPIVSRWAVLAVTRSLIAWL